MWGAGISTPYLLDVPDLDNLLSAKVPPKIMTSYDGIANESPVYNVIDQYGKIYAGLLLVILSYDVACNK